MRFQRYANREQSDIEQLEQFVDRRDYSSRLLLYLRRITHLNNFVHSTVGPMQLASCFIPRTNSLKCIVQLCRNVFFFSFFCATYAFSCVHSFPPFFFPLSFFFHFIFFPLPLCNECLWADRETQSRCLRKIFFFFWSESTRFRFLKRINRRLNRCSRLGADERTNDRVISDRWRCAIRQLYIRSCSASNPIFLRSEEEGEFIGDSFFFLLHLIFKNKLNRHSDVILILQLKLFFGTTKNRIPQNKIDYNFTRMELHNVI